MESHKCTLTELYPSIEMRALVRVELGKLFSRKFLILMDECITFYSFLVLPMKFYEKELKNLFIEEGLQLDSSDDLEFALKNLGYLKWEKFRRAKSSFERSSKISSYSKIKYVKFNIDKK